MLDSLVYFQMLPVVCAVLTLSVGELLGKKLNGSSVPLTCFTEASVQSDNLTWREGCIVALKLSCLHYSNASLVCGSLCLFC